MKPSNSRHHIEDIWRVFTHRVDAAVCIATGDIQTAEIHLKKAKDVFVMCGWMVGADVFVEGGAVEFDSQMRRPLCVYSEYIEDYELGIESGLKYAKWDKENRIENDKLFEHHQQCAYALLSFELSWPEETRIAHGSGNQKNIVCLMPSDKDFSSMI